MTENLATHFVDPEHVYKVSLCFYTWTCAPRNMIDIASNFSTHQESPVYVGALSLSSVFFAHSIL